MVASLRAGAAAVARACPPRRYRLLLRWQGWLHCILYVLFENAMGVVKLWAVVAGAPRAPPAHSRSGA